MKSLILDFLRRWWWLFVIALLLSITGSVSGFPFVFAPAAVIALLLDAQRGVFRAVRSMPVSRVNQAKAWWIIGVPLLPLLSVPVLVIGVLIFQATHSPTGMDFFHPSSVEAPRAPLPAMPYPQATDAPERDKQFIAPMIRSEKTVTPWFAAGVQAWVALGYAGFCFFLMQWAPTRPAENLTENVQQGIFGALWGLSMPGVVFLLPNLPRSPAAIAPWHWAAFVAVPIFVALSYFTAADVVQRRMFVTGVKARPQADSQPDAAGGGPTGVPLFVANFAGRIVMFVVLIILVQTLTLRWMSGGKIPANNPPLVIQIAMMVTMMAVMTVESVGMRALRVLPLSTARLAALLSLIPWVGGLCCATYFALWSGIGDPGLPRLLNLAGYTLALCGWATLTLAVTLHISSSARIFVLVGLGLVPAVAIETFATHIALFAAIGVATGASGFALLVRGLLKSSAFYRPRGFFGMTPGQPSAVR